MPSSWLGVDGTRTGWVVYVLQSEGESELYHIDALSDLDLLTSRLDNDAAALAIDMPIGLLDIAERGGRGCDREARRLLSQAKRNAKSSQQSQLVGPSSIFTPPSRKALIAFSEGGTHTQVSEANRASVGSAKDRSEGLGLSIQTFHILPKIREADSFVSSATQECGQSLPSKAPTFECHPELAFLALSRTRSTEVGLISMLEGVKALRSKKLLEGRQERWTLLCKAGGLDVQRLLRLARGASKGVETEATSVKSCIEYLSQIRTWRIRSMTRKEGEEEKMISVAADDVLDAIVCATAAQKWSKGEAKAVEEGSIRLCDTRGLPMVIWI
jgi:predicted RNase H-like nuclease